MGINILDESRLRPVFWLPRRRYLFGDPSKRGSKEPVDQYSWYQLSRNLGDILSLPPQVTLGVLFRTILLPQMALDDFGKTSPLKMSVGAAKEIEDQIRGVLSTGFKNRLKDEAGHETEAIDFNQIVTAHQLENIKKAIRDFETILAKESPTIPVFFVPKKGIYDTASLIDNAEQEFASALQLPHLAIQEIKQAGRCLAFDLFTAHAIHMMRAAEIVVLDILRIYHNEILPAQQRNWMQYVIVLRKHGADPDLLRYLEEVVRIQRNEAIHPTRLLKEREAQAIYVIAKGAILALTEYSETLTAYDPLAKLGAALPTP